METTIYQLDKREALYTIKKKSLGENEFENLFKILNRLNNKVVDFRYFYYGDILFSKKRVFSVRDLAEKSWEGRRKRSILMTTTPSKDRGFFIPWTHYSNRDVPDVVQILCMDNLVFENSVLIKKFGLKK